MADPIELAETDTLEVEGDTKSSARVLSAIKKAANVMNAWQGLCDNIDDIYAKREVDTEFWADPDYDLFWASTEILKPAVYARPPEPVVSPEFKDRRPLQNVTAELLERSVTSAFGRTGIDEAMCCTRDDLIFYNRGQIWVTYESDDDGQKVCVEHLDRKDFLHPPARKWSELPWVARRAWMTKAELRKRFRKHSGDAYMQASTGTQRGEDGGQENRNKVGVWEVWHKADKRVYWVAEGVPVMLDEGAPHLKLRGFFPCPRPAYGTLRPRTLIPVPDYVRYSGHFNKINSLTRRIYALLDMVRMKGLIPSGGEIGDAVEQALRDDDNAALLIPVPAATLIKDGGQFVQWMPLRELAEAITGLIEARRELFSDFDRLSGISDIMRGETEAQETLGAQRLKSQYGSVRVREKIEELQRIAADVTEIAAEIMAENFEQDTLLEMSQMEIPKKSEIEKRVKGLEDAAAEEMRKLGEQAKQMLAQAQQSGEQVDPAQAQQQLQQAQQQIIEKYGPQIQEAGEVVPVEDVMKLLRDNRARGFAFEIATDSTVLTDEIQEKASRAEMLNAFTDAMNRLMPLFQLGPEAVKLAGAMLKFALQPYRVGRELNSIIDDLVEKAPEIAQQMQAQQGGGEDEGLAAAQMELARAEMAKVESQTAANQANAELKMQELQLKASEAQEKARQTEQQFGLSIQEQEGKIAETVARIKKIEAEIEAMGYKAANEARKTDVDEFKAVSDAQAKQSDQAMQAQNAERDAAFRAKEDQRADHGEARADRQQDYSERSGERQQTFAERQAAREPAE